MRTGSSQGNFSFPLAVVTAISIVLLMTLSIFLLGEFDRTAQRREQTVVGEGVKSRVLEVASTVLPQVMWDDAVENLDNKLDANWALENIGVYLYKTTGFEGAMVLDAGDRVVFATEKGKTVSPSRFSNFLPIFKPLVTAIRDAERRRGPLPAAPPADGVLSSPVQSSTFASADGKIFIVVATLVAPDFGRQRPRAERAPIVMTILPVDQQFLDSLAQRFLLRSVHLHSVGSRDDFGQAHAPLVDFLGREVGTVHWLPEHPGRKLLARLGGPIFAIVALLFAALQLVYRRSRRMAEGLIASEIRATHMALHDTLTGLPNRALFLNRLEHGLAQIGRRGQSVVVHCIDLDRFKDINDSLGHLVGDELLRAAAKRMASQCRASETFARLSGDEFAIVQNDASAEDAGRLASRICNVMSEPFQLGTSRVFSGCSVGIARTERSDADPLELFRQADLALYRVKASDRGNFFIFEPEMDAAVKARRSLEADLRVALDTHQLQLFYQPQVDSRGIMTGVEALVRWEHPDQGHISPSLFVPIAEQSGLIQMLGLFTIRRAFAESARWRGLKVGINISANQIRSGSFVDDLAALVTETAVDPADFELEITEGVLLSDDPETLRKLQDVRRMGFSLALDDFGTGFSSLSYLRKFPIDKIKIDRSFIANVGLESESEEVVSAIIRLARALRLNVIAEGVENLAQWSWLRSAGCGDAQGYFFSAAVCAQQIELLWQDRAGGLWARADDRPQEEIRPRPAIRAV